MSTSTVIARTRRLGRDYKGRPKKVQKPKNGRKNIRSKAALKNLNKRRGNLGIAPLDFKFNNIFHSSQWSIPSATQWSFEEDLCQVAIGATNETRESNRLKFLPTTANLFITQPQSTEFKYRVLLVKIFNKRSSFPDPNQIFTNSSYWWYANYKKYDDRVGGSDKFKVLYDKFLNFSTYNGNSSTRRIKVPIPGCMVKYDDDDTTGGEKENAVFLMIYTDATASSATHKISCDFNYYFLDQ